MRIAEDLGVDHDVVLYIKEPPDAATLREIIAKLEDPPTDLVRRDSLFKKLGLTDADVGTVDQIVDMLVAHKQLLQRPLLVTAITKVAALVVGTGGEGHDVSVTPQIFLFYAGLTFVVAILFSIVTSFYRYQDPEAARGR